MPYPKLLRSIALAASLLALAGLALAGCAGNAPQAAVGRHSATLTWTASKSKVENYRVFRTTDPNASPGLVGVTPGDTTRFVDTTVEAGRTYYYSVKAVDAAGNESDFSQPTTAVIPEK